MKTKNFGGGRSSNIFMCSFEEADRNSDVQFYRISISFSNQTPVSVLSA